MGIRADRRKKRELDLIKKQEAIFEANYICHNFCSKCQYNKIYTLELSYNEIKSVCEKQARNLIIGKDSLFDETKPTMWRDRTNGTFVNEECPSLAMMLLKADVDGLYKH